MKKILPLLPLAAFVLSACAPNAPYHPSTKPEKIEYWQDSLDIYPGDVRKDPAQYKRTPVAWAGIIKSTETIDSPEGYLTMITRFEHHYFDWEQDETCKASRYTPSARGEGEFKTTWLVKKVQPDADQDDAYKFASPGKLAIVYGTPQGVDDDGTVQVKYRYLRVIDPENFSTNQYDYGRFGEPIEYLNIQAKTK